MNLHNCSPRLTAAPRILLICLVAASLCAALSAQQTLYNGIVLPDTWPPLRSPTQAYQIPPYITSPPSVIPIDLGRQLFVDDFLIQATTLQRTPHRPAMHPSNPVLTVGGTDTGGFAMPYSDGAWFDPADNLYKMWYLGGTGLGISYAYSADGINWVKPSIPDAAVPNSNIVVSLGYRDSATVWMDLADDPSRKFKAFVFSPASTLLVYFSSDGIHWTKQTTTINSNSDRTTVFWNPFREVWVDSMRGDATLPATATAPAHDTRVRFYAESPDLLNWNPNPGNATASFWAGPDENDPPYVPGGALPELYNLDGIAYESLMVGLFSWYNPGPSYSATYGPGPNLVELGVGFSRDGFYWVRPTRGSNQNAFIPATNVAGTWNAYNTQSVGGGFVVVGDQLWFYFSGRTLQKPQSGIGSAGVATLRRDGFYSMDAGSTQGTLTTRTVQFTGSHLFVNVADPSGQLTVEVLDSNGNVIPGFGQAQCVPIAADSTAQEVTWTGGASLSTLAGSQVQFRFYLTSGSLYSFWVTPSANGASYGYVAAGGPGFTGPTDTVGKPPAGGTVGTPLITPPGGNFTSAVQVVLTDATPGAAIYYTLDGSAPSTSSNLYTVPFTLSAPTTVKAQAFLSGMNPSLVNSATFNPPDSISPSVAITSPTNGQIVVGTIAVSANASDNVGITGVRFGIDGALIGSQVNNPPYAVTLDTTSLSNGSHQISAVAIDTAGNQATATASITIQNTATNAAVFLSTDTTTLGDWKGVYGQDGNYIVQHSIQVPGYATFAPVNTNQQLLDNFSTDPRALQKVFFANSPTERIETQFAVVDSMDLNTSANDNQWHRIALYFCDWDSQGRSITVEAHDATSGAILDSRPLTDYSGGIYLIYKYRGGIFFRIQNNNPVPTAPTATISALFWGGSLGATDTTPPVVSLTSPAGGAILRGTVNFTVNASDDVGVAGVQYKLDGADLGTEHTMSPFNATWDTSTASGGSHQVVAIARDEADNFATSTASLITIDNVPPTVSISAPGSGTHVSGTVAVDANASDNVGLDGVQFQLDGANLGDYRTVAPYSIVWDTTTVATGNHTLTVLATDLAGNVTTSVAVTVNVNSDSQPPTVSLTAPASGSLLSGNVDVTASASDNVGVVGVQFLLDNANLGSEETSPPFSIVWSTTAAALGNHSLSARARDAAGNTTTATAVSVMVDNQPPAVSVTAPAPGPVAGTVNVTASASDNVGVASVQFQLDGASLGAPVTTAPYSTSWNTTTATGGTHTLTAVARDTAGNPATSSSVQVTVDNQLPTVSVTAPAPGPVAGTVNVTANASDNVGVASVQFQLDGASLGAPVTTAPYSTSWNTTAATNGSHTLTAVARDTAGNPATSSSVQVTVDNQLPTVSVTAPAPGPVAGTVNVTANASDNVGVASVQFQLDGASLGAPVTTAPYSTSWNTATATGGTHTLTAVARDTAGNPATSSSVQVTVDNQLPTVSVTAPAPGPVAGTVNVTANASDNVGVASVQFQLDGASLGAPVTTAPYSTSWNTTAVTNGSHTLTAVARDTAGNPATSSSVSVTVDNQAPITSVSAPVANASVAGVVAVTASASDNLSVASVQFQLDGVNLGPALTSSPFTTSWNTATTSNGVHQITSTAVDSAGNQTVSAAVSVTVDNVPSTGTYAQFLGADTTTLGNWKGVYGQDGNYIVYHSTQPPAYSFVNPVNANTHLVDTYSTDPRALQKIFYAFTTTERIETEFYSRFNFDITVTSSDNQSHRIALYFCDWTNIGRSITVSMVDAGTSAVLDSRQLTDYRGGVYLVYNYRGAVNIHVQNNYEPLTTNPNGTISAIFWGGSGLPGSTDTAAPTVSMTAPANASTVSGTASVSANASDNVGVTSVQFKIDNNPLGSPLTVAPYTANWDTTTLANGSHTVSAVASDAAGNLATASVSVTVSNVAADTAPPTVSLTAPANASTVSGTVGLSANASDNVSVTSVQFKIDNNPLGSPLTVAPYTANWDTTTLANGSHTVSAVASDAAGNLATASATVTVSNPVSGGGAGPVGYWTFDTLTSNQVLDSSGNNLTGTLSGGVTPGNGKISQGLVFGGVNGSVSFASDTLTDLTGDLTLAAWVKTSNNSRTEALVSRYSASGSETGYLLRTNPAGHVELRIGGNNLGGSPATFTDTGKLINDGQWHHVAATITIAQGVRFYIDGALTSTQNRSIVARAGGSGLILGLNGWTGYGTYFTGTLDDVRIYNRVLAASEIAALPGLSVTPDTAAPTVSMTAPANASTVSGTASVSANASDNVGVTSVQFKIDNNPLGSPLTAAPYTANWDTTTLANGSHTVSAVASDAAGNLATASVSVTVSNVAADTAPPTVSLTAPANASTVSGTVGLSANASDNVSVTSVQFKIDNNPLGSPLTVAPYTANWDTTTLANGSHTVSAVASDAAGNLATASATVTVSNPVSGGGAGPVGYWTFDTLTSNQVLDSSGNNLTGTLSGGVTPGNGKIGQGLVFGGVNGRVSFANDTLTDLTGDLTLAAWVKTSNNSRTEALVSRYSASGSRNRILAQDQPRRARGATDRRQ